MEWEDWISLLVFFALFVLPKKKRIQKELREEVTPEVEEVRKKIEALKQQRTQSRPVVMEPQRRNFTAYQHLPKPIALEKTVEQPVLAAVNGSVLSNCTSVKLDNLVTKKRNLHHWVVGQIVLGTPAYRKNYGNFMAR